MKNFEFTYKNIESYYEKALLKGYRIITCDDYVKNKYKYKEKLIVNRVDIDFSIEKTKGLLDIYKKLKISASFFVRLHAKEYNPFSFENYRILKKIINEGHEIGLHSEIIDQSVIWKESPEKCLVRDLDMLGKMLDIKIKGVASHGGMTGLNNLDFWIDKRPSEYGLLYEAYDNENEFNLMNESFYISDSEWIRWKCYDRGVLQEGNHKTFGDHLDDNHELIYLLIHTDTYFENHFYE